MAIHDLVKLFDQAKIRVVWDDEKEKYYFSVVDVVGVLTEQQTARNATVYWAVMKKRLKEEGAAELITNCKQLKLVANDGKRRETDVADLEGIFSFFFLKNTILPIVSTSHITHKNRFS